jgi:hypothetical protein
MAVGDDAGFCIIYSMGTHIRPVARLETVACQQRARYEQEKIREQIKKTKGKLRSVVKDTSETTIHAIGMVGSRVVLATSCELECMDVLSQTSLWVCPLTSDRLVTSLDVHMSTYDVLVSCAIKQHKMVRKNIPSAQVPSSPLMLLQHSRNNIEICDANSLLLVKSPCCTAIWDASKSAENRLLFVAVSDTDQELEVVLVQGGSIDNWKVACKTRIPFKASNHQTKLCQSPEGIYTLVASSRGIRLYQTETLQLINTYGDQLALHGKSVVWQDCLLLNSNHFPKHTKRRQNNNLTCEDWLSEYDSKGKGKNDIGPYVIGVPNFKGPKELCETLHVWKIEEASTVPTLSIPIPARAEGVQGLVGASIKGNDRLVLATRSGFGHTMLPTMESNFAGIMYPPGYNVINNNIEYLEDEDELDFVANLPEDGDEEVDVLVDMEDITDEDLREAMRQSLLEKKLHDAQKALNDKQVDILFVEEEGEASILPCRPEPSLRHVVNAKRDEDSDAYKSSSEEQYDKKEEENDLNQTIDTSAPTFIEKILDGMPNAPKKKELSEDGITVSVTKVIVATTNPTTNRPGRGKRSRATNLEAALKSSIDPRLQKYMIARQSVWSDGVGSKLYDEMKLKEEIESNTNVLELVPTKNVTSVEVNICESKPATDYNVEKQIAATYDTAIKASLKSDEAAVALGLLGLSPCNARSKPRGGRTHGSLLSGSISPTLPSEASSRASSSDKSLMLNHIVYTAPESAATSDAASEVTSTSMLVDNQSRKPQANCNACRGRYVVHTCGNKAMPIDYDEVAKAERERIEKKEEEKKKARAEKRRLADARRREARKQKQRELEEQRRREEEEERLEKERLRLAEEAAYAKPQAHITLSSTLNSQLRGELIASAYTSNISACQQQSVSQPVETSTSSTYASSLGASESYRAQEMTHNNWGATTTGKYAAPESEAPVKSSPPTSITRHTSVGTLSSADALVALANFAGSSIPSVTTTRMHVAKIASNGTADHLQVAKSARSSLPFGGVHERDSYTAAASFHPATHNFGAGLPVEPTAEPKLSIPSYASLQGASNGRAGAISSAERTAITEQMNGSNQSTNGFIWPPQAGSETYSSCYKPTTTPDAYHSIGDRGDS